MHSSGHQNYVQLLKESLFLEATRKNKTNASPRRNYNRSGLSKLIQSTYVSCNDRCLST